MAGKLKTMSVIKQLILMHQQGLKIKPIAKSLQISRNTVRRYLNLIEANHWDLSYLLNMDNEVLEGYFTEKPGKDVKRYTDLHTLFPGYAGELKRTGVNLWVLWNEYKTKYPDGYSYPQFCFYYRKYSQAGKACMHFDHEPGDKLFMDFSGKKISYIDKITGKEVECEFFVSVLGHSQLTYAEAAPSQSKASYIECCQNALHYFGGVPKALIPDNLKSAVTTPSRYEAVINEDFLDMASHYGCAVLPTRSRKPQDKSLVEVHVDILYSRVFAPLRDCVFFSLKDLNDAIREKLQWHNSLPFQGKEYSRRQLFDESEKQALLPLPQERYHVKEYYLVKVMKNCHVQLHKDHHYYSVPFRYIGEKVKLVATARTVSIYYKGERIAFHLRDYRKYHYTTVKEHLPSSHQFVTEWNPDKFIHWAAGIDPQVKEYITGVLAQKIYPEQLYRSCVGILSMERKAGRNRLIAACKIGNHFNVYSYMFIQRTIRNGTDQLLLEEEKPSAELPPHENIRGAGYYALYDQ